jgi:hypothetical protein
MNRLEITVKFHISYVGTEAEMMAWCKDIGIEPSWLSHIRWLAEEEGLMGIVDDGYEIVAAQPAQEAPGSTEAPPRDSRDGE